MGVFSFPASWRAQFATACFLPLLATLVGYGCLLFVFFLNLVLFIHV